MEARIVEAYNGEQIVLSTVPPLIEDAILLAFGHSILEFEATLYEKFLRLTNGVVVTCQEFKEHLKNMEERSLIVSAEFLGKQCWARNTKFIEGFVK
ncbi:MAG: hypothetical protein ACFFEE_04245 [Candidatus Thorarchaeota archaeon]